jgi:hypothetical protein
MAVRVGRKRVPEEHRAERRLFPTTAIGSPQPLSRFVNLLTNASDQGTEKVARLQLSSKDGSASTRSFGEVEEPEWACGTPRRPG